VNDHAKSGQSLSPNAALPGMLIASQQKTTLKYSGSDSAANAWLDWESPTV